MKAKVLAKRIILEVSLDDSLDLKKNGRLS